MDILRKSQFEEKQDYDREAGYDQSKYIIQHENLILNTITDQVIRLGDGEKLDRKFCVENYLMMPKGADQYKICKALRKKYNESHPVKPTNKVIILTTTDCNARCWYCYENGCNKRSMSEQTAISVAQYLVSHYKDLQITWFGGEPLFNKNVINIITNYLTEHGVTYTSMLISNGSLFETVTDDELKKWNLKQVQITLDGVEGKYNEIKRYSGDLAFKGYHVVLKSINRLIQNKISVSVRLNVSPANKQDLMEVVDDVRSRCKGASIYTAGLYGNNYSDDFISKMNQNIIEINRYIYKTNGVIQKVRRNTTNCFADNKYSRPSVITPDGNLSCCEHCLDGQEIVGNVVDGILDPKQIATWKVDATPDQELCHNCKFFPYCMKMEKCGMGHFKCHESDVKQNEDLLLLNLLQIGGVKLTEENFNDLHS